MPAVAKSSLTEVTKSMPNKCLARSMPPHPPFCARTSYHLRPVTTTSHARPDGDDRNRRTVCLFFSGWKSGSRRQNSCPASLSLSSTWDKGISRTQARVSSSNDRRLIVHILVYKIIALAKPTRRPMLDATRGGPLRKLRSLRGLMDKPFGLTHNPCGYSRINTLGLLKTDFSGSNWSPMQVDCAGQASTSEAVCQPLRPEEEGWLSDVHQT